jgi:hypothetical protein
MNAPETLRQLVPASILAGRWIGVLVCYLDDSGKDRQNPITTVAGYIARDTDWDLFETDVEKWFDEYKVGILHAKQLEDTDGDFKGWSVLKKQAFVSRMCQARDRHVMMGLSMSAEKDGYQRSALLNVDRRVLTPYAFCFNVIVDWILRDIRIGRHSNTEGVAFVLEKGHENNPEAEKQFYEIRKLHKLESILHSISFVSKDACRAIQLADLIAFYSRRDGVAYHKAIVEHNSLSSYNMEMMLKIITQNLPHRGFIATRFSFQQDENLLS